MDVIIEKIKTRDLPLSPAELQITKDFCQEQIIYGNLQVINDELPEVLYRDWLDKSLGEAERAYGHFNVSPEEWRTSLVEQCGLGIKSYLSSNGHLRHGGLIIWRGGLPNVIPLNNADIKVAHVQTKRHPDLKMSLPMPLSKRSLGILRQSQQIVITDVMNASGSSLSYLIDILVKNYGFKLSKIVLVLVASAPEGVYLLLKTYLGIRVITVTLHGCLNAIAYIIKKGLGDAGRKFFAGLTIEYFLPFRHQFSDEEWQRLEWLLDSANHARY